MIAQVVASERATAQTSGGLAAPGVVGLLIETKKLNRSCLESSAAEGESPVGEGGFVVGVS